MKSILLFTALVIISNAAPCEAFWGALHIVETGGGLGPIKGDHGAALGPLQIRRAYFQDSHVPGRYEDCADLAYSRRVVTAYLQRYAPKAWQAGDCDLLARVHNGGPGALRATGNKRANLVRYSAKVLSHLP